MTQKQKLPSTPKSKFKRALQLGAISLLAMSSAAYAEPSPEYTFQPASKWSVQSGAQTVANGKVQSCTASAEFNNGFVVTFDGSHKWVQSLQIDLRQDALEAGKTYEVNLSVPGQIKTATKGSAHRANVININLNGQKQLYQAMRDNAVLDVSIEDNTFRFFMVNFLPASKKFERCMAGGDITAQPKGNLSASASSDPFAQITANEAIAFEDAEVKNIDITKNNVSAAIPVAAPAAIPAQDVVEQAIETPAAIVSNARSVAENATISRPAPRQRVSESLAAQIQDNPELVALDNKNPGLNPETKTTLTAASKVVEAAPVNAPEIVPPAPAPKVIEPAKGKSLVVPPAINDIPLDDAPKALEIAKAELAIEQSVNAEAPVVVEKVQNKASFGSRSAEGTTADDLNRMQLEKLAKRKPVAPKQDMKVAAPVINAPKIVQEKVLTEPMALAAVDVVDAEPFSKPLEKVKKASTPKSKIDVVVQEQPDAPIAPISTTKKIKTRPIVTKTKTEQFNVDFTGDDKPTGEPFKQFETRDPDIGRKISQLEKMIQDLQQENAALEDELNTSLKDTEGERLAISSDNWNLERATMRFNEAERQLKTIGQQLQRERAECSFEKKELETMLFDPQITDNEQLARLSSLERQLQDAQSKLSRYEGGTQ